MTRFASETTLSSTRESYGRTICDFSGGIHGEICGGLLCESIWGHSKEVVSKGGSSDKFVLRVMERQEFQEEEILVSIAISFLGQGFYFVVDPFHFAAGDLVQGVV
jgi:hypothetical protein